MDEALAKRSGDGAPGVPKKKKKTQMNTMPDIDMGDGYGGGRGGW